MNADDLRRLNARMLREKRLYLYWVDQITAQTQAVFDSGLVEKRAAISVGEIASPEPAVRCEGFCCRYRIVQIACHDVIAAQLQFTLLPVGQDSSACRIDDSKRDLRGNRRTSRHAPLLCVSLRVAHRGHRETFGHAVQASEAHSPGFPRLRNDVWAEACIFRKGAAAPRGQREISGIEHHVHHCVRPEEMRHAMPLYGCCGGFRLEDRQQHASSP